MTDWDASAATYDATAGHGRLSPPERKAWMQLLGRLIDPARPRQVLDVGTGTGFLALLLAELGHAVTAVDPSERMLQRATAKAAAAGLTIDLRHGDADDPGLPDGGVDVVVCRHVLWLLEAPERTLRRWARILRPGGQVIAIDGVWRPRGLVDRVAGSTGKLLVTARTRRWPRDPEPVRILPLWDVTDPQPAGNAFRRAGLRDVRTEWLAALDRIERAAMSREERLTLRWRRYLVEGSTAPNAG